MANVPAWSAQGFGIRPAGDKIYSAGGCQNIYWEFVKRYIGRLSEYETDVHNRGDLCGRLADLKDHTALEGPLG